MTLQLPDKHELDIMHLENLLQFVDARDHIEFLKSAGEQHYRLLAWLSTQFNSAPIFDIGTWRGSSAVALSHNPNNVVYSFNVQNERQCEKNPFNVSYRIQDLLELKRFAKTDLGDMSVEDKMRYFPDVEMYIKLQYSPLVVVDVHNVDTGEHDGDLEQQFYDLLTLVGFRGLAVFDDVRLNDKMRRFAAGIELPWSDVTHIGHGDYGAGTGIIDFSATAHQLPKFKKLDTMKLGEVDANGRPKNWCD